MSRAHPGGGPVAFLYVFSNGGGISTYFDALAGPYDDAEDTQVAVLNNSSVAITSLSVKGPANTFNFDGDGLSGAPYNALGNAVDKTGYGEPRIYFTNINTTDFTSGTINFIGGLAANGGTTYFSLEEAPTISQPILPTPEPSSLTLISCGMAVASGYVLRRRAVAGKV